MSNEELIVLKVLYIVMVVLICILIGVMVKYEKDNKETIKKLIEDIELRRVDISYPIKSQDIDTTVRARSLPLNGIPIPFEGVGNIPPGRSVVHSIKRQTQAEKEIDDQLARLPESFEKEYREKSKKQSKVT